MRSTVANSLLLLAILGVGAEPQTRRYMSDPVFGITYDIRIVHFEWAPTSLEHLCSADLKDSRSFWVYGSWVEGDTEYYVISNQESSDSGGAAVIHGSRCTLGLPDWVLTGDPKFNPDNRDHSIRFPDSVLHGLARDLLRRYSLAFGGKKQFLEAVRHLPRFSPDENLPPVLGQEFKRFSASP